MVWRLVRSLETLRANTRTAAPRAAPPATPASAWGTVGDNLHDSTSDHTPKIYPALGSTAVVCAADFPHAPALGLDGGAFTEAIRLSRDPRVGYVIFNGRIFSGHLVGSVLPFTWRPYSGSDRHDTHYHVSTVHTALADDTRPWRMPGSTGGTMAALEETTPSYVDTVHRINAVVKNSATIGGGTDNGRPNGLAAALSTIASQAASNGSGISAIQSKLATPAAPVVVTLSTEQLDYIIEGVAEKLGALRFVSDAG